MVLSLPKRFGRYELVERLATGGMAELFKATMEGAHNFHKRVVIKKILPELASDEEFVSMFIDEAKITAQLMHPKIVQVFELGTIEDELFIAMELVDGLDVLKTLRHFAKRRTQLPTEIAIHIAHEVLDALDYAHSARNDAGEPLGIVHRDISPGNILLSRKGNVKLTDFGIARAAANRQKTEAGILKGKYSYMSPEQVVNSEMDSRSDLFAVGVVLCEMLMGRRLFVAPSDLDVLIMVRDVRLERLDKYGAHIAPELREIIDRALTHHPDDRFQTARDFRDALGDYLFSQRKRIHAQAVASMVMAIQEETAGVEPPPAGADKAEWEEISTLSGPTTLRRQLERQEAAALGRSEYDRGMSSAQDSPPPAGESRLPSIEIDLDAESGEIQLGLPREGSEEIVADDAVPEPIEESDDALTGKFADVQSAMMTAPDTGVGPPAEPARPRREPGDEQGDFAERPALSLLYDLAADRSTGLLEVELSTIQKSAYFIDGAPQYVESNVASERLGEFLVNQGKLSDGELSMALSVLDHFGGKLGDTLIGLGLMNPLGAMTALTEQVRFKVVDICTWQKGRYRWFENRTSEHPFESLSITGLEICGAGALALEADFITGWAASKSENIPQRVAGAQLQHLGELGLGSRPREVYYLLDGSRSLGELNKEFGAKDNWLDVLRVTYLLVQAGVIEL